MHQRVVFNFGEFKSRKCSISFSRGYMIKGQKSKARTQSGYLLFGGAYSPNDAVCRRQDGGHRPRRTRRYARVLGSESEGRVAQNPTKPRQPKKRKNSVHQVVFRVSLVAGVGFEPHDLRVMSPTSYQTAPSRDINGAGSRGRTGTRN